MSEAEFSLSSEIAESKGNTLRQLRQSLASIIKNLLSQRSLSEQNKNPDMSSVKNRMRNQAFIDRVRQLEQKRNGHK